MNSVLARVGAAGLVLLALTASSALAANYPLGGYFIFHRASDTEYTNVLNDIQAVGGKVLVTFGPGVRPVSGLPLPPGDPDASSYNSCTIGGVDCFTEAANRLQAQLGGGTIRRRYLMSSTWHYGDAAMLRCALYDVKVTPPSGGPFYRLVIPTVAKPPGTPCAFTASDSFDVYVVWQNTAGYDRTNGLLLAAAARQMHVFVGIAVAPSALDGSGNPVGWEADIAAKDAFVELNDRLLLDWTTRYGGYASFHGFYQSFETWVNAPTTAAITAVYTALNQKMKQRFPDKKIMVSPYWSSQKKYLSSLPPAQVSDANKAMAAMGFDIIVPQDGRGVAKTAPFYPYQVNDPLPTPLLAPNTPHDTYGEAFFISTQDMYRYARQGIDAHNAQTGSSVQLWANLEAFEPSGTCGGLGATTKDRVDTLIGFDKTHTSYMISFMWDPLFYCTTPGGLKDEIAAQPSRPIIYDVQYGSYGGVAGLRLKGFNLVSGVTLSLTWYNSSWAIQSSGPGLTHIVPTGSDGGSAWVPFNRSSMAANWYLFIVANGGANGNSPLFAYQYPVATVPSGASFLDTTSHSLKTFVEWVHDHELIAPCGLDQFCPDQPITRADVAVALVRRGHGVGFVPSGPAGTFKDVSIGDWRSRWIEQLALDGITGGCGTGIFCPQSAVSRAQAAVFILRAKHGAGYTPPPATGIFSDVSPTDPLRPWMEQMYQEGITGGCGTNPLRYCPADPVTRAQMSVFLQRITP